MKTVKKEGKFPVIVSEGGVTAKIRKTTQTKNGKEYIVYIVDYILFGKRKSVSFNFMSYGSSFFRMVGRVCLAAGIAPMPQSFWKLHLLFVSAR
jgi:hypothetical protein